MRFPILAGLLFASLAAASPIQVTLTGVNGQAAFGVYVGPYYGAFGSSVVTLYCDDWANDAFLGETWSANLTPITSASDLGMTRFGTQGNALQLYQQIAWLDTQFATQPVAQFGDIHATIWQIFDPIGAPAPSSNFWSLQAQQQYANMSYDNFRIVTNTGPVTLTGQVQEFLTMVDGSPGGANSAVPEPAPMILIGSGLMGGAFLLKLIRKKSPI